jgi:hypothetical protein
LRPKYVELGDYRPDKFGNYRLVRKENLQLKEEAF